MVCLRLPLVAVTVSGYVAECGVGEKLPHALMANPATISIPAATSGPSRLRRKGQSSRQAIIPPPSIDHNGGMRRELWLESESVRIVVTALLPPGVTVSGENAQAIPAPGALHEKDTAWLKPFCGVTVRVTEPGVPPRTSTKEDEEPRENSEATTSAEIAFDMEP